MLPLSLSRMIALIVSLAILFALLGILSTAVASARSVPASPVCMEDQPCWTWSTMGNRERGVFIVGRAHRVIVNPCTFRRVHARIDWTRTLPMRGDYVARTTRCI